MVARLKTLLPFSSEPILKKNTSSTPSKQQPQHACESLPQKTPLAFFHQDFQKKGNDENTLALSTPRLHLHLGVQNQCMLPWDGRM